MEVGRLHAVLGQTVAEVPAWERAVGSLLPVDHQMVEVNHLTGRPVIAGLGVVVGEILVGDDNVVAILFVVGEFVDGVLNRVGFDDERQRLVRSADFDQPRLAEPVSGIDDRDVFQFVAVELAHDLTSLIVLTPVWIGLL